MSQLDSPEIQSSRCFGIAYDKDAKECKMCEVARLCEQRVMGDVRKPTPKAKPTVKTNAAEEGATDTMAPANTRPEPKKEAKPAKKEKPKKAEKNYDPEMPDFKSMDIEDLEKLASEREIDLKDFEKYTQVNIRRMRLIMSLKKTYEV